MKRAQDISGENPGQGKRENQNAVSRGIPATGTPERSLPLPGGQYSTAGQILYGAKGDYLAAQDKKTWFRKAPVHHWCAVRDLNPSWVRKRPGRGCARRPP